MDRKKQRTRTITLQVSDEDMKDLCELALNAGSNVSNLLEGFIEDLAGNSRCSGSDEHSLLRDWYERRGDVHFRPYTFPVYLLNTGMLDEATEAGMQIEELRGELLDCVPHSAEAGEIQEEKDERKKRISELIGRYYEDTGRMEETSAAPYHLSLYIKELKKYDLR